MSGKTVVLELGMGYWRGDERKNRRSLGGLGLLGGR
jgi:hypothetical protein